MNLFFSALLRFDLDSWGSDENDNITGTFASCMFCISFQSESSLQMTRGPVRMIYSYQLVYEKKNITFK